MPKRAAGKADLPVWGGRRRIPYGTGQAEISYAMLAEAYGRVVRTPLEKGIEKIKIFMKRKRISFQNPTEDSFKLCFSGIFGCFDPVREQIETAFAISSHDKRSESFFADPGECHRENARGWPFWEKSCWPMAVSVIPEARY